MSGIIYRDIIYRQTCAICEAALDYASFHCEDCVRRNKLCRMCPDSLTGKQELYCCVSCKVLAAKQRNLTHPTGEVSLRITPDLESMLQKAIEEVASRLENKLDLILQENERLVDLTREGLSMSSPSARPLPVDVGALIETQAVQDDDSAEVFINLMADLMEETIIEKEKVHDEETQ